jgi:hypothetical protein
LQQSCAFVPGALRQKWERIMRHTISNAVRELSRTFAALFDGYRPELHYMRGPGPKCSAKHSELAPSRPMPAGVQAARRAAARVRA